MIRTNPKGMVEFGDNNETKQRATKTNDGIWGFFPNVTSNLGSKRE